MTPTLTLPTLHYENGETVGVGLVARIRTQFVVYTMRTGKVKRKKSMIHSYKRGETYMVCVSYIPCIKLDIIMFHICILFICKC